MFFKGERKGLTLLAAAIAILVMALCGCSLPWGSRNPSTNSSIVVGQTACLSHSTEMWQDYFNGVATPTEMNRFWSCTDHAVEMFLDYVRGRDEQEYTAGELRAFVELTFLDGGKISDPMMVSLMRLKRALIGGSERSITRAEIDRVREMFPVLRDQTLALMPYVGILTKREPLSALTSPDSQVEAATYALEQASDQIQKLIPPTGFTLASSDLETLLSELQNFGGHQYQGPEEVANKLPLINKIRQTLLASPSGTIESGDWTQLMRYGSRLWSEVLRYHYLLGREPWQMGPGFAMVAQFGSEAIDLVETAVRNHPGQIISFDELNSVLETLNQYSLVPFGLTEQTAQACIAPIAQRYLRRWEDPNWKGDPQGLTLSAVTQARHEFNSWVQTQRYIDHRTGWPDAFVNGNLGRTRSWKRFYHYVWSTPYRGQPGVVEFQKLLAEPWRFVLDNQGIGRLRMSFDNPTIPYDIKSLTQLNWRRLFIRLVNRGYAQSASQAELLQGLTLPEFHQFYQDIFPLALELDMLDPRDPTIWSSVFRESRIFTFAAESHLQPAGEVPTISYEEGVWLISYAFSTGAADRVAWNDMLDQARVLEKRTGKKLIGDKDIFNINMLDAQTFRTLYIKNFSRYYSSIPALAAYVATLAQNTTVNPQTNLTPIQDFMKTLETATRRAGYRSDVMVEYGDLSKMSMLFHYVESMYLRYDRNHDGILDQNEIAAAYPLLEEILSEVSPVDYGFVDRSLLDYLVKQGQEPTGISGVAEFIGDSLSGAIFGWNIAAPRLQLMRIFALLHSH